jgi:hypothetical protein
MVRNYIALWRGRVRTMMTFLDFLEANDASTRFLFQVNMAREQYGQTLRWRKNFPFGRAINKTSAQAMQEAMAYAESQKPFARRIFIYRLSSRGNGRGVYEWENEDWKALQAWRNTEPRDVAA